MTLKSQMPLTIAHLKGKEYLFLRGSINQNYDIYHHFTLTFEAWWLWYRIFYAKTDFYVSLFSQLFYRDLDLAWPLLYFVVALCKLCQLMGNVPIHIHDSFIQYKGIVSTYILTVTTINQNPDCIEQGIMCWNFVAYHWKKEAVFL